MSNKKQKSKNGFMDFCLHQQRLDRAMADLRPAELVERCSPIWDSLTLTEKNSFKSGNLRHGAVYRALGSQPGPGVRPQSAADRENAEAVRLADMMKDIKTTVVTAGLDNSLELKEFFILSSSVFCITSEKEVVPAALSIAKMSLKEGVVATYHVILQAGNIPRGYMADCIANSKATHNIPLDYDKAAGDYNKVLEDILIFMMEGCRHDDSRVPPLYCDPKQFGQNMLVLDWLLEKANSDLTDDIEFRLYSLPALLFYMVKVATSEVNSSASRSRTSSRITEVNKVPSYGAMKWKGIEAVSRDTFMYLTDCCDWHLLSEVGRYHCCKAIVLGYSFILLSLVCPLYSLPLLEVSHMPAGYTRPDLCSKSLTRSAASDVSNVTGSSRSQRGSGTSKASSEASQSSSFNLSSYSRNGTTTSQRDSILHYLKGKGRGISHQGRIFPVGRVGRIKAESSLDLSSDMSFI